MSSPSCPPPLFYFTTFEKKIGVSGFKTTPNNKLSLSHRGIFADKSTVNGSTLLHTGQPYIRALFSFCVWERVWVRHSCTFVNTVQMLHLCSRYLIYFCPFDVFYYLCAATPVRLMLLTIHEFARAKKVLSGVTMAAALYPNSLVAMAIVGMFKGRPVPISDSPIFILFCIPIPVFSFPFCSSFPFQFTHSHSGSPIPILTVVTYLLDVLFAGGGAGSWGITWYRLLYLPQSTHNHEPLSISL